MWSVGWCAIAHTKPLRWRCNSGNRQESVVVAGCATIGLTHWCASFRLCWYVLLSMDGIVAMVVLLLFDTAYRCIEFHPYYQQM